MVNPALVVLGGELAQAGDLLLDPLRRAVERNGVDSAVRGLRIVTGALGEDSQLHGALALALIHVLIRDDLLDIDGMDQERAGKLIMAARAHWFE